MRRSSCALSLGLLLALAIAPTASATIVIGQSIAGVKLGDTKAQVEAVLGKPEKAELSSLFYLDLRIGIEHGKVGGILSSTKKQKTSKGITIGSSHAQVKNAYPQANCLEGPYGPQSLYCAVTTTFHGRESYTSFLFGSTTGGVEEIELGYGKGIAQELKAAGK